MIKLDKITKKYGNNNNLVTIFDEISLEVQKGEMVAIMGPSGSGKTTLINIIGMLDKPESGEYYFNGDKIDFSNLFKLNKYRGKKIGFVVQNFALIDDMTVKENFELILEKKLSKEEYAKYLKMVGLEEVTLNKYPLQLSGGQQQRVAIARSLLLNPDIFIADEPTGALDSRTSKMIMEIFRGLKKQNKTIIIVTHDIEVAKYCDKVYMLKEQKIIYISRKGKNEKG